MKRTLCVICVLLLLSVLLTACSKEITVVIKDAGQETTVQTKTDTTVKKMLEQNGISLHDKDEVDPSLDFVITEDTKEITIKRYAKVTVKKGHDAKEVELVGATVKDAVDASGFKLDEGEELDHDEDEYLTDGMVINIVHEINVTLNVDGETREVKTKAVTVKDFLYEQEVTLGADDEISEAPDTPLKDGMEITIKRIEYREVTRTESIDYETIDKDDDSMYKGETKTTQEGSKGEKEVTYRVKYVDGEEESKEKLSEKVTKEPTDEIVVHGTKAKKLTEEEAEKIVREFWNNPDTSKKDMIVTSDGLTTSGDKEYYGFRLRWLVDNDHYSTIDFQYVNAYTGEVVSSI